MSDKKQRQTLRSAFARRAMVHAMPACIAGLGTLALILSGPKWTFPGDLAEIMLCAAALFAVVSSVILHRRVRAMVRDSRTLLAPHAIDGQRESAAPAIDQLQRNIADAGHALEAMGERLVGAHHVTGMPTREILLRRMALDQQRLAHPLLLGVIELTDYHRLSGFDPAWADSALRGIAERIARMARDGLLVAHIDRATLAIWFGIDTDPETARTELNAIAYAAGAEIEIGAQLLVPTLYTGAALMEERSVPPETVIARALASLASRFGKGDSVSEETLEGARRDYGLEQDLRHAIARGELALVFQPLIDASTRSVSGAEALLRWHHPVYGIVSPLKFMPIVEAAGLADDVGLWVLNAACREAGKWRRDGFATLRIAVNISGNQLNNEALPMLVERTAKRHGLPASAIIIELTETVAAHNITRTKAIFDALRQTGVSIAIDDFGTGYSSLSYLKNLSFDKLKIDREFVTLVDQRTNCQAICQSIIALARGLGIEVLAEGVERWEEYEWLRRHGCMLFQGYYFSRPVSGEAFRAFLDQPEKVVALSDVGPDRLRQKIMESAVA